MAILNFGGYIPRNGIAGNFMLNFSEELPKYFSQLLYHFTLPHLAQKFRDKTGFRHA